MKYTIEFQPLKPGREADPNEWYVYDTYSDNQPAKKLRYLERYNHQFRFRVRGERSANPHPKRKSRGSWPKGKTPPHLKKYLFK